MSTGYKQLDRLQDRGFPAIVRADEQIYSTKIMQLKVRKASEFIDDQMPEHRQTLSENLFYVAVSIASYMVAKIE